jgi:hypothetical protein
MMRREPAPTPCEVRVADAGDLALAAAAERLLRREMGTLTAQLDFDRLTACAFEVLEGIAICPADGDDDEAAVSRRLLNPPGGPRTVFGAFSHAVNVLHREVLDLLDVEHRRQGSDGGVA